MQCSIQKMAYDFYFFSEIQNECTENFIRTHSFVAFYNTVILMGFSIIERICLLRYLYLRESHIVFYCFITAHLKSALFLNYLTFLPWILYNTDVVSEFIFWYLGLEYFSLKYSSHRNFCSYCMWLKVYKNHPGKSKQTRMWTNSSMLPINSCEIGKVINQTI